MIAEATFNNKDVCKTDMDAITDVSLVPLTESRFLTPMRMLYKQAGKSKLWDLMKSHSSVAVVIFNTDTDKFVFVKQFRPACYLHNAALVEGISNLSKSQRQSRIYS